MAEHTLDVVGPGRMVHEAVAVHVVPPVEQLDDELGSSAPALHPRRALLDDAPSELWRNAHMTDVAAEHTAALGLGEGIGRLGHEALGQPALGTGRDDREMLQKRPGRRRQARNACEHRIADGGRHRAPGEDNRTSVTKNGFPFVTE